MASGVAAGWRAARIALESGRDGVCISSATGEAGRPAASASPADQLTQLADLRERGVITTKEFSRAKDKVLP
jgi:hypothetical protein